MIKKIILPLSLVLTLNACSSLGFGDKNESVLEGDRMSLYDFEKTLQKDPNTQFGFDGTESDQSVIGLPETLKGGPDKDISLVAPWDNNFWPQVGGYANHAMKHVAFNKAQPKRIWSYNIGKGATTRMPLTAAPIMADGKVFAFNNEAELIAVNANTGKEIWKRNIIKSGEDEVVIGGGIAFSGGRILATNGFNELVALNAENGDVLWRTQTKNPVRAAPAALPNRVFITTMDNETIAYDSNNGQKLWAHRGLSGDAGVLGAATPAITRDAVIAAYSSGEIYALQIDTGTALWSENLSPLARAAGITGLSDIRALPVVDSNIAYAASFSNRMSAIDTRTGKQQWQIPLGSGSTPWVSGNRIFMVESQGTLISINRLDGSLVWQEALPRFEDEKDRDGVIIWQGPYLAGGRLLILGSHGEARSYSPVDGSLISKWSIGNDILLPAAFANETMYLLGNNGRLSAWK